MEQTSKENGIHQIPLRIPESIFKKLRIVAESNRRSINQMVIVLIEEACAEIQEKSTA